MVHPPIIDREIFDRVQVMLGGRAIKHAEHKPHRSRHPYALRGCVWCGLCDRRMQGHWAKGLTYYRCRFAAEYALANRVQHPLNVNLREDAIIGQVDGWLAREFAPHRLAETIRDLAAVQLSGPAMRTGDDEIARKVAECDRRLAQYRAALDARANPVTVAAWITETEAEKASYALVMCRPAPRARMSEAEIKSIVDRLADIAGVLRDANPHDKAEVFRQLGLKLTYHPGRKIVEARVEPMEFGFSDGVRGGTAIKGPHVLATQFLIDDSSA